MTYDILYQQRGGQDGYLKTVKTEKVALKIAADLVRFPADTIHIFVVRDDGNFIYDSRRDGLL